MSILPKKWVRQLIYILLLLPTLLVGIDVLLLRLLPNSVHFVLPVNRHKAVITQLAFRECYFSVFCQPKPGFTRLEKNLFLNKKWIGQAFVEYQQSSWNDLTGDQPVVLDLAISNIEEDSKVAGNGNHLYPIRILNDLQGISGRRFISKIVGDDGKEEEVVYEIPSAKQIKEKGWEKLKYGLWVKYGPFDEFQAITNIDVLYGFEAKEVRHKWIKLPNPLLLNHVPVFFSFVRKGEKQLSKPKLKINSQGKFKILQVADLHFSTLNGTCQDPVPPLKPNESCFADARTLRFLNKVLDIENPDLVVLTGDQIYGDRAPDSQTAMFKALEPFISRKIPYALTLGNHDDEGSLSRDQLMEIVEQLPYSLSEKGPAEIDGVGNFYVPIHGSKSSNVAVSLYFLDTHKYSKQRKVHPGYDWIKENQLEWLGKAHNPYLENIENYSHIHLSMGFFHIPLPEYRDFHEKHLGSYKEGVMAPTFNSHARNVFGKLGVGVISVGHDHCNDYCLFDEKDEERDKTGNIWLCYGGAAGEGGYGGYGGTTRRLRLFSIDSQSNDISTWKRLESSPEDIFEEQILVKNGVTVWE
ncbi:BA75_03399T0 [Komagataella pastoris]|uniref:BA75_03399T0 n=1 Tax=Komagataella pastoris TaxID=4922 RepID=A0A1B2JGR9_PICPA|nr:BA75_03399T0 [Komagataella pastoris]